MSKSRLLNLQSENNSKGLEMMMEAGRFKALADRHENGLKPKAISAFNLFQTPENIADKMASMIPEYFRNNPLILEPSAGLGRLYKAVKKQIPNSKLTLVENSPDCMGELYRICEDASLKQADFLSIKPAFEGNASLIIKELPYPFYDVVIMNPPFKMGTDVRHIMHALKFLHIGGFLVALCYDGVKQNKILKPICDTWEKLPPGSFKSEGAQVDVILLTITKKRL